MPTMHELLQVGATLMMLLFVVGAVEAMAVGLGPNKLSAED